MERASADYMGMLATVMNALAMQDALEKIGVSTRVQSAIPMATVCEPYIRRRALRHLEKGRVVIFAAGTGARTSPPTPPRPCAPPRCSCDALSRAPASTASTPPTPRRTRPPSATRRLSYQDVLAQDLRVMDASAVALMRDNNIPIVVFSIKGRGNLLTVLEGEGTHTVVSFDRAA
jgi:uridylate kinase